MTTAILLLALLGAEPLADAQARCREEAKDPSRFKPGDPFAQCMATWKRQVKEESERDYDARLAVAREENARRRAEAKAHEQAAQAQRDQERADQRQREEVARAEAAAEAAKQDLEFAAAEKKQAAADEARRKKCGKYLDVVSVGMAWARVRECAGPFSVHGQVSGPNGVVSVYQAAGGVVWVKDGVIAAWRRNP